MRIGLDLDNTLAEYTHLFVDEGRRRGLLARDEALSRVTLRDRLRADGREDEWTLLQGAVYGERMTEAALATGAAPFLEACRARGIELAIVSHRTKVAERGPAWDLHAAAWAWLRSAGLMPTFAPAERVFLETTRAAKLARIAELGCDVFVDDLPEVLVAKEFPASCRPVLFDPAGAHGGVHCERVGSFEELGRLLFGAADLR